jgi:hypothetical protein
MTSRDPESSGIRFTAEIDSDQARKKDESGALAPAADDSVEAGAEDAHRG